MEAIHNYNIKLRLVEETDADFIIQLRTDTSKAKFISPTDIDIDKQKDWIRKYKQREKSKDEYYFIAIDEKGEEFATYRIYNKTSDSIEIGSFVSKPFYNIPINVIKVDIILKEFVFVALGYNQLNFEVRKENKSVISYHKKFHPYLKSEDDLNFYFVLTKENFLVNKRKFEKLF
ncbi:GNAT family N-acetyltransferase [Flavobacterium bizetiae]|uniref:GNAT family N-acetyltransferase n=1 Tax=Flavobacterium bizetiae TaxID=2704140 RepID=UPI0021E8B67E|nr:GNAT family N-acetyltransferase [Flavobacterium bizetiae]UTN04639.1 GNAT family N-acetyltransferase [Flavobacterium bizetiae]